MIAEPDIDALNAWLVKAGLSGETEAALVSGFCDHAVAAGLPINRALVLIDSLHPVYEGRVVRWGHDPSQPVVQEYRRTVLPAGTDMHLSSGGEQAEMIARWRASPFFHMLQTGESLLRRRVTPENECEFPVLRDFRAAGMTDYLAIINRFAPEGIIGEWIAFAPRGRPRAPAASPIPILQRSRACCRRLRWGSRQPRSRA